MQDRFNFQTQIEHLHAKYVGTGTADTTRWEWASHVNRDSLASHIGHPSRMAYFGAAENESVARLQYRFLTKMINPCGAPPPTRQKGEF